MSTSADGSVKGKKDGRKRVCNFSSSKNLRRKSVRTPLRSARLTASSKAAPRQSHVQRLFREARIEFGGGQRVAAGGERSFDLVFRFVETRADLTAFVRRELGEILPRLAQYARLSEVARLDVLEIVRVVRTAELRDRPRNKFIQIDHSESRPPRRRAPPFPGKEGISRIRRRVWPSPGLRAARKRACRPRPGPRAPCDRLRSQPSSDRA